MPQLVHHVIMKWNKKDTWSKRLSIVVFGAYRTVHIDEVTSFAYGLSMRHFYDSEMPPEVIHVSRVSYLLGQVLNGGFWQFVENSGWATSFVDGVRSGLVAIGAVEHLAVFDGAAAMIDEGYRKDGKIDIDRFNQLVDQLEEEHLAEAKLKSRLGNVSSKPWNWGDRWSALTPLMERYIAKLKNIRRVRYDRYEAELDKLTRLIPDLEQRKAGREEARPWEKKRIDQLVDLAGQSQLWYTGFSERQHDGQLLWAWNMRTNAGHHQVIFHDGEAIMFSGRTDEIVARIPAPEQRPDSGVPSHQPAQQPGTLGKNIMLLITNP